MPGFGLSAFCELLSNSGVGFRLFGIIHRVSTMRFDRKVLRQFGGMVIGLWHVSKTLGPPFGRLEGLNT